MQQLNGKYLVLPVITSPTIEQTRILSKSLPLSNTLVNIIEVNISMQSHLYLTKETGNMKKVCLDAAARKAYAY